MKFLAKTLGSTLLLILFTTYPAYSAGKLLNAKEKASYKIACAKIDNQISNLYRRIQVLKDAQNRRVKIEEVNAIANGISSSLNDIFADINTQLATGNLFPEDSKMFIGKLDSVRRSLSNLGY